MRIREFIKSQLTKEKFFRHLIDMLLAVVIALTVLGYIPVPVMVGCIVTYIAVFMYLYIKKTIRKIKDGEYFGNNRNR